MGRPLPRPFFARDADVVARDLLGRVLVHETERGRLAARVVETEAYFGPPGRNPHLAQRRDMPAALRRRLLREGDPASHTFPGLTKRNQVMYGPPGYWYVYLIYGIHECTNVTTGPLDAPEPQAVLLRGGEAVEGLDAIRENRGGRLDLSGPGKLAQGLGVTRAFYGIDAVEGPLRFEEGTPVRDVDVTPRIGVVGGEDLPLRFVARPSSAARSRRPARAGGRPAPPGTRRAPRGGAG
ncbi:MAG TPA: DNA-3-methyladenine glycosylase [Candidatus Thermoplasmatota archaeon]|nr:DNA-3-methyladenine glycosylase [Candidatus Thermoplasmatota archaeon]